MKEKKMKKEMVSFPVAVHKASITLLAGETIQEYIAACRIDIEKFFKDSVPLEERTDVYIVEIFSRKIVVDVWIPGGENTKSVQKYFSVSYERKKDGSFTFTNPVEVEIKTVYKPKSNLVTKSKKGVDKENKMEWVEKKVELWNNIL